MKIIYHEPKQNFLLKIKKKKKKVIAKTKEVCITSFLSWQSFPTYIGYLGD